MNSSLPRSLDPVFSNEQRSEYDSDVFSTAMEIREQVRAVVLVGFDAAEPPRSYATDESQVLRKAGGHAAGPAVPADREEKAGKPQDRGVEGSPDSGTNTEAGGAPSPAKLTCTTCGAEVSEEDARVIPDGDRWAVHCGACAAGAP